MCRFLLVRSKNVKDMRPLLQDFAVMCERSRTTDGDRQEDGWGVAWINGKDDWQSEKSLHPIWEDKDFMSNIPSTRLLVAHARSASFPSDSRASLTGFGFPSTLDG